MKAKQNIRSLRRRRGLTLKELSRQAGVSSTILRMCERGLTLPSPEFFIAVAEALKVNPITLCDAQAKFMKTAVHGEGYVTAKPDSSYIVESQVPVPAGIPVLDLFCGVGGFSYGFEQTNKFTVQVGIDLLPDRIATFAANHPHAKAVCSDIRNIDFSTVTENCMPPEVIIGGPPCQGFSSIRPFRTLTEGDSRNNLFEHFVIAIEHFQPKWFVMENVIGMLTHKHGKTLHQAVALLKEIGYKVDWKIDLIRN